MDYQPSSTAPDASSVLKFAASLVWRSKWLIGGATVVAAAVAFALAPANAVPVWTGKTILTIGLAPGLDYLLQGSGVAMAPIETSRNTVARISDPVFRGKIAGRAAFESATAATSRSMVSSSLRAIAQDSDRDIVVELSAGSAADVQAAFRAVAAEIGEAHGEILKQRQRLLQSRIDNAKSRIAMIEKSSNQLNDRIFNAASTEKFGLQPSMFTFVPAWSELQDRIQRDTDLKELSEPSVLQLQTDTYFVGPRSVRALTTSILAGLAMLVAMIVLTILVYRPARKSTD
jgi:hypothetical protein